MEGVKTQCYCESTILSRAEGTFQCRECKRRFHPECLKNPVGTPLAGDTFYDFTCCQCASDNSEQYFRAKMSWQDAVILTLYNLQLGGGGKRGYFRWKDQICAFIDKHWSLMFRQHRKKRPSWHGTVAGTVSAGCPRHFVSGTAELGEPGWWKLAVMKPPTFCVDPPVKAQRRSRQMPDDTSSPADVIDDSPSAKRTRRSKNLFSLSAASELKAKRSTILDNPGRKRRTMAAMAESLTQVSASQQDMDTVTTEHELSPASHTPSTSDVLTSPFLTPTQSVSGPVQLFPVQVEKPARPDSTGHPGTSQSTFRLVQVVLPKSDTDTGQGQVPAEGSEASGDNSGAEVSSLVDGDGAGNDEESLPPAIRQEISTEESLQGSLLSNTDDSDEDCPDMFSVNMSSLTLGTTLEPCHSPDMVDLVLSMPGTDQVGAPSQSSPVREDMLQTVNSACLLGEQILPQPAECGKHPPQTSRLEDSAVDSEGPSEGEEGLQGRSEGEEEEEEVEEEEEERDREQDASVTVLSVPARTQRRWKRKARGEEESKAPEPEEDPYTRLRLMTPYDEKVMLEKLESIMSAQPKSLDDEPLEQWKAQQLCQQRNLLRRKLLVRKLQRENGLPVFDIGAVMTRLAEKYGDVKPQMKEEDKAEGTGSNHPHSFNSRTLDRFMRQGGKANVDVQHTSFHTRLVGFEDHQLQPITSPYTMRVLKPFIWRDTETVPLKVKLMQEIIGYPHRNDPTWTAPHPASLDYCYVRPQHIPSVNALCCAYFWPGIDLSECLQYPDFSCVVMYRKLVVGFAFLVPDVKHNEAYISFIFTRPDWRGAGIASFMLYHLSQTCMGKDITLHVSATNPAMLLYQKFGFKAEELCLDFYDKYFPVDSKECKHAFFMRLR